MEYLYNYRIKPEDIAYAEEFRRKPVGHHSPGLQRVLNRLHGMPLAGKPILVCTKPHREWTLALLSGVQGVPPKLVPGKTYRSLHDGLWDIFRTRWKMVTGEDLEQALARHKKTSRRVA